MKVIFLDIDGVLNSNFWNDSHQKEISDGTLIQEEKVRLLGELIKRTKAEIILHSGWKYWFDENLEPTREESRRLYDTLKKYGITIFDVTPDHATEEIRKTRKFSLVKAGEILEWITTHEKIEAWVVLDDLDLHNDEIALHQVRTNPEVGLTEEDVKLIENKLGDMRKVILFIATSMDGYIADQSGKIDWLGGDGSDPDHQGKYDEFINTVDDVILGYSTYHQIVTELDTEHWTYEGKTSYVLTHRKDADIEKGKYVHKDSKIVEEIKFVDVGLWELISDLKKKSGKNIWICGGASIIKQAMEENLIDEFELEIMPKIVGSGIRLFEEQPNMNDLQLVACDSYNGIVHVKYVKKLKY